MSDEENNVTNGANSIDNEQGNNGDTATPNNETTETKPDDSQVGSGSNNLAKTFTEDKVNEIVRNRLEKDRQSLLTRYGVQSREELDDMITKALSYNEMKSEYDRVSSENGALREKLAFIRNNINPTKENEIKCLFKGMELEFNEENLAKMLADHPEWVNVVNAPITPKTTIQSIGGDHEVHKKVESEDERQRRIFGI